jgi:hypothetical protein
MLSKLRRGNVVTQCQPGWADLIDQWIEKAAKTEVELQNEAAAALANVTSVDNST